jgi:hypothetical protein
MSHSPYKGKCPPPYKQLKHRQEENVKYLGLHLDSRLIWRKHILAKRKQLGMTPTIMYWLPGRKSKFCTSNKLLTYKAILASICTCGIQVWGTASSSNIEILERFLSETLRTLMDAPWFMQNTVIHRDLQTRAVKEEIRRYSSQYSAPQCTHPNGLVVNLMAQRNNRRLQRRLPHCLRTGFLLCSICCRSL